MGDSTRRGWSEHRIDALASAVTSGGTPQSGNPRYYSGEGAPFAKIDDLTACSDRFLRGASLRITEAALRETPAKIYPPGTILVSMYGTIGLAKTTTVSLAANQALCALLPPFSCDASYLAHFLVSRRSHMAGLAAQTTQANISGRIVKGYCVTLPPRPEQRQIAEILDTVDKAIHKTEEIIAKLEQVKQGLLHDLLTRGIDDNGELRDPDRHPEQFKDSPLGRIPKDWAVVPGDLLFRLSGGVQPPLIRPDSQGQFLYLKVNDFNHPSNEDLLVRSDATFDKPTNRGMFGCSSLALSFFLSAARLFFKTGRGFSARQELWTRTSW